MFIIWIVSYPSNLCESKYIFKLLFSFHVTTFFCNLSLRIGKRQDTLRFAACIFSVGKIGNSGFRNIHVKSKFWPQSPETRILWEFCFLFLVVLNEIHKYIQFTVTTITTKTYVAEVEVFFFAFCHLFALRKSESLREEV